MVEYIQRIQEKALTHIMYSFDRKINPICALEMGLGKTRIACKIIKNIIEEDENFKILIVIKASNYKDPWINELLITNCIKKSSAKDEFDNCVYLHGKERLKYIKEKTGLYYFQRNNIFITAYDTLRIDIEANRYDPLMCFNLILFDELQLLINADKLTKKLLSITKLSAYKKIALTGSPSQNTKLEIGLMYIFLNDLNKMSNYLALQKEINDLTENCESEKDIRSEISKILEEQESILLEGINNCNDNIAIYFFYNNNLVYKRSTAILSLPIDLFHYEMAFNYFGNNTRKFLQKKIMFLSSPSALNRNNSKVNLNIYCTKEIAVEKILKHMKYGEKAIIFSLFKGVLISYYNLCQRIGYPALIVTGKDKDDKLQDKLAQFKYTDKINVLLTTLQKSSEGFNFDYANHIIILEFWWNPQKIIQAMSRVDRITQKRDIFIYILSYNITISLEDKDGKKEQNQSIIKEESIFLSKMQSKITETKQVLYEIYKKNKSFFGDIPKFKDLPKIIHFKNINTFESEFSVFLTQFHIPKIESHPEFIPDYGYQFSETIGNMNYNINYHNQISNTLLNYPWRIWQNDINQYLINFYDHIICRSIGNNIKKKIQEEFKHSLIMQPKIDNNFPFIYIDDYSFQVSINEISTNISIQFILSKRQSGIFQLLYPLQFASQQQIHINNMDEMNSFLYKIGITNISTIIIGKDYNIDYTKINAILSLSHIFYTNYTNLVESSYQNFTSTLTKLESLFMQVSHKDSIESLMYYLSEADDFEKIFLEQIKIHLFKIRPLYRYSIKKRTIIGTTNIVYFLYLIIQTLIKNINFDSYYSAERYIAIAADEILKNGDKLIPNWNFINKHVQAL